MLLHDNKDAEVYIDARCVSLVYVSQSDDTLGLTAVETNRTLGHSVLIVAETPQQVWRLRASELSEYCVADRLVDCYKAKYEEILETGKSII
jgi:hypothetical protein